MGVYRYRVDEKESAHVSIAECLLGELETFGSDYGCHVGVLLCSSSLHLSALVKGSTDEYLKTEFGLVRAGKAGPINDTKYRTLHLHDSHPYDSEIYTRVFSSKDALASCMATPENQSAFYNKLAYWLGSNLRRLDQYMVDHVLKVDLSTYGMDDDLLSFFCIVMYLIVRENNLDLGQISETYNWSNFRGIQRDHLEAIVRLSNQDTRHFVVRLEDIGALVVHNNVCFPSRFCLLSYAFAADQLKLAKQKLTGKIETAMRINKTTQQALTENVVQLIRYIKSV